MKTGCEPAPGELGELCVRGSFLAMGYYGVPDKTAESFVQNPLNCSYPELIYKTGISCITMSAVSWCIWAARIFRSNIWATASSWARLRRQLYGVDGIRAAVCFFDEAADKIVCVYEGSLSDAALVTALRRKLPKYMLPNRLRQVAQMPYNANGKIDRVRLREAYVDADH